MKRFVPVGVCLLLWLAPGWASAQQMKPPRLALVSTERSEMIANLLTLAEVKLTAGSEVEVLDRKAIDRVLAEQKLSLAGFVKSDEVLKVGKLLTVDLFALLESDKDKKKAVGLVVFDARTGVRLWDTSLSAEGLDKTVTHVVDSIQAAADKFRHQYKDLFTICLTTVRNVDLPRDQDAFCDTVGVLLERGLVTSPSLVLLERSRLDQVNKERNIPTDSPLQQLLASLVRVELEIARSPGGKGLRTTALLYGSGGQLLGRPTATVAKQDAAEMAQALLPELTKTLKARPASGVGNRIQEAERFFREAAFFRQHKDPHRGLRALEAANALKPGDLSIKSELANTYFECGAAIIAPYHFGSLFTKEPPAEDLRRSLEYFLHGTEAMLELDRQQPVKQGKFIFRYDLLRHFLGAMHNLRKGHTDETQQLLRQIHDRYQHIIDLLQDRAFAQVTDKRSFEAYTIRMGDSFGDLRPDRFSGLPADQLKKNQKRWLIRWLSVADKYGTPPLTPQAIKCAFVLLRDLALHPDIDFTEAQKYRAKLLRDADPYIRLADQYAELQIQLDRQKLKTPEQRLARVREFRLQVQKIIQSKEARQDRTLSYTCYMTVYEATDLLRGFGGYKHPKGQEMGELCRFMLSQNDLVYSVAGMTLFSVKDFTREGDMKSLEFAEDLLRLIDAPHGRLLAPENVMNNVKLKQYEKTRFKNMIQEERRAIVRKYPELERKLVTPWESVEELIDVAGAKQGIIRLLRPIVHEGAVYVIGMGHEGPKNEGQYLELLRFSLADGQRTALGRIAVEHRHPPHSDPDFDVGLRSLFGKGACIHDGRYYLGSSFLGIFVFPLNGDRPERIYTKNGLPSDHVHDLACVDGKLYAGLGEESKEGYLVAIDLESKQCKVVASSRRKEKLSPFDDSYPLFARGFVADAKRHRVLFMVSVRNQQAVSGLWEINTITGKLQQRWKHYLFSNFDLEWVCTLPDDKLLLATSSTTTVYDLKSNEVQSRPYKNTDIVQTHRQVLPRLKDIVALTKPGKAPIHLRGGDLLFDGWLWTSSPFGRVSLDGDEKCRFPQVRTKYGRYFNPNEGFQIIDQGARWLFADQHGIWLALLARGKDHEQRK